MNTTSKKCRVSLSEQCVLYVLCVVCVLCSVCCVLCAVCSLMYKKKGKAVDPENSASVCQPSLGNWSPVKKFRNVPYTKNPSRYWYIIIRDYLTLPFKSREKCRPLLAYSNERK